MDVCHTNNELRKRVKADPLILIDKILSKSWYLSLMFMGLKTKIFSFEYMSISVVGYVIAPCKEGSRIDSRRGQLLCSVP